MDSNDLGDIQLLMLDDDLFWKEEEKECGLNLTTIQPADA